MDYNNNQFISRQFTFSLRLWHFWGTLSSLLPFTKYLPSIYRPNSCIVVWKQLICYLVLSASLSLPLIGCPWFTKSAIFVNAHTKQRKYAYMHYVHCGQTSSPVVGAKIQTNSVYFIAATFWVPFGVAGLCYILDYRIDMSSPFYTLLVTTYPPSVSPENHVIPFPPPPTI